MSKYRVAIKFENCTKYITVHGADSPEVAETEALEYYSKKAIGNFGVVTVLVADDVLNDTTQITLGPSACPTCGRTIKEPI